MYSQGDIIKELIEKQLTDIIYAKKMSYNDIKRVSKFINTSIFNKNECCLWSGYVTNLNNKSKGTYINFYFRNKKIALHRLLYINYVDNLTDDYYLRYTCKNKGICCCVYHLEKYKYKKKDVVIKKKKKEKIDFIITFD